MLEIYLSVWLNKDNSFFISLDYDLPNLLGDSVFTVKEYPYTPWPRKDGNLLW